MEKQTQAQIKAAVDRQIWAIVRTLHNGDRVELIPVKDGVKVLKVHREQIKRERENESFYIATHERKD